MIISYFASQSRKPGAKPMISACIVAEYGDGTPPAEVEYAMESPLDVYVTSLLFQQMGEQFVRRRPARIRLRMVAVDKSGYEQIIEPLTTEMLARATTAEIGSAMHQNRISLDDSVLMSNLVEAVRLWCAWYLVPAEEEAAKARRSTLVA